MKKNLILSSTIFAIVFLFVACSEDDEKTTPVENPISSFMADSAGDVENDWSGTYELGSKFKSSKSGEITQLCAYVPTDGKVIATLWKASTKAILAQTTIESKAGKKVYANIDPITIEPNEEYIVSVNVTDITDVEAPVKGGYYVIRAEEALYPVTKRSITIINNCEQNSATPTFPINPSNSACIIGVADFTFVADK